MSKKTIVYFPGGAADRERIDRARAHTGESRSAFIARAALAEAEGQKPGLPDAIRRRLLEALSDTLARFE